MLVSLGLPTHRVDPVGEFVSPAAIAQVCQAAEHAGFGAVFVTDHPCPPDRWLAAGGHHGLDPFVALTYAAAVTSRLRLQTNLLVAPYRNPYLLAKAAASLDLVSGGRLILGLGAGYLEDEFRVLGVDIDERNDVFDAAIPAITAAWSGESFEPLDGTTYTMLPRPEQRPRPPVWVGGNSHRAIRRAVEYGDGWVPFPTPRRAAASLRTSPIESLADVQGRLGYARQHAERVGRAQPLDFAMMPPRWLRQSAAESPDAPALVESLQELAAAGATAALLTWPAESRTDFLAGIDWLGEHVLNQLPAHER